MRGNVFGFVRCGRPSLRWVARGHLGSELSCRKTHCYRPHLKQFLFLPLPKASVSGFGWAFVGVAEPTNPPVLSW